MCTKRMYIAPSSVKGNYVWNTCKREVLKRQAYVDCGNHPPHGVSSWRISGQAEMKPRHLLCPTCICVFKCSSDGQSAILRKLSKLLSCVWRFAAFGQWKTMFVSVCGALAGCWCVFLPAVFLSRDISRFVISQFSFLLCTTCHGNGGLC